MPAFTRVLARATFAALVLVASPLTLAQTPPAPPPVSAFFGNAPFGDARLSPSGRHLAVRASAPGKRDFLTVIDLETNSAKIVAHYNDADVRNFYWINDRRLVFDTHDKGVGPGDQRFMPGMYAVDFDGGRFIELASRNLVNKSTGTRIVRRLLPPSSEMAGNTPWVDSDDTYALAPVGDTRNELSHVDLLQVNTVSGQYKTVPRPGATRGWLLDHKGEPRLAITYKDLTTTLQYLDPATGKWRELTSFPAFKETAATIEPVAFGPTGTLFVTARGKAGTTAMHTFDVNTGKLDPQPLLSAPGYDIDGELVINRDKVLGMQFRTDAVSNEWFDAGMKAIQQDVDKLLPTTVNLMSVPARGDSPLLVVTAYSDVVAPVFFLYNSKTKSLNKVGEARPGIDPTQMGRQQFLRYKARDGLDIPALLTLPPGAKRTGLPLVVMVHGGPWVRGKSWGWAPDSQFLATRGYAVLEPEFRGSLGFGSNHERAGYKQWGLAMQNDIADGVRWAVDKGLVDPKRVCIAGASYGGYSTLMGLVNDPDMFRCGISFVGVTDIGLLFDNGAHFSSDTSRDVKQHSLPERIGDPVKDADQFKATSPLQQAARITQPLLLAYGGVDRRVPINHGTALRNAVMRTNKQVEWIEYPEEGHGWALEKNRIDFWGRVEKFLDKNIGSGAVR
ncbi:S9 family peptidase [Oxalobacteraceae sp. CFBP 13708]|nr:S9 family peptidase [Oxalobacteraceae sp. CFBP 13708]